VDVNELRKGNAAERINRALAAMPSEERDAYEVERAARLSLGRILLTPAAISGI